MRLTFKEEGHKYESDLGIKWSSVTRLIEEYSNPFDPLQHVKSSKNPRSVWYEMDPLDVKRLWEEENTRSTSMGHEFHAMMERRALSHKTKEYKGIELPIIPPMYEGDIKIAPNQILKDGIYPEHLVYNEDLGICGQVDLPYIYDENLDIIDWKGLALDTPIPTESGFKNMEDIVQGDVIFDGEGNKTTVEHVSNIHHNPCYKITFDTNDTLICDHEHRWVVTERLRDGTNTDEEITTDQMKERFDCKKIIKIKCTNSLNIQDVELPIDPYVLGCWLGDGSKADGKITNMNQKMWDEIERRGYKLSPDLYHNRDGKVQHKTIYGLRTSLISLGLLKNKHIPDLYMRSSHKQRLDLLRGFMDADGHFNVGRKRCVMITTKEWQANDIMNLVSSLGWKPTIMKAKTSGFGKTDIPTIHVTFRALDENPFLARNENYLNLVKGNEYMAKYRYVKNIEKIDTVPTKCLSVCSPTHTYLAGKNYIKTHNTNKEIKFEGYAGAKMLGHLSHLPDCNYYHYALQLNIYGKLIMLKNPNLTLKDLRIIHVKFKKIGEDKYKFPIYARNEDGSHVVEGHVFYDLPHLQSEVEEMLFNHQKNYLEI